MNLPTRYGYEFRRDSSIYRGMRTRGYKSSTRGVIVCYYMAFLKTGMKKTDDLCSATITEYLELSITTADIERTHQIGKSRDAG